MEVIALIRQHNGLEEPLLSPHISKGPNVPSKGALQQKVVELRLTRLAPGARFNNLSKRIGTPSAIAPSGIEALSGPN